MGRFDPWVPWLLFAAATLLYLPSVRNGFVYDDNEVILAQEPVRSASDVARIFAEPHGLPLSQLPYYRPITRASLLIQKGVHGDRAGAFHAVNAILAGVAALAAYALLRVPRLELPVWAAGGGAFLFAAHPVTSSCVYPIASGRETLLPVIVMLAAAAAHLRGGVRGRSLAVLCFGVALLGKEQAVVLLPLFAWADCLRITPEPRGRRWRAAACELAAMGALFLGYLVLRGRILPRPPDAGLAGILLPDPLAPVLSLLYALQVSFAPFADVVYEPAIHAWLSPGRLALALAATAALALAMRRLPPRDRRVGVFFAGWFPLAMAVTLNLLPQEARFAERFVLLSLVAPIAVSAILAARLARDPSRRRGVFAVLGLAAVALGSLSLARGPTYRDGLRFARQWVATDPLQANARYSLGTALARSGALEEAVAELRAAVRLDPGVANAHYNLGVALARTGRLAEATAHFEQAVRHAPGDADAHRALAVLLERAGRLEEARSHRDAAARLSE